MTNILAKKCQSRITLKLHSCLILFFSFIKDLFDLFDNQTQNQIIYSLPFFSDHDLHCFIDSSDNCFNEIKSRGYH